jgi:hypothetical protein
MKIEVNRDKYRFVHGHGPRGTGLWMFEIVGSDGQGAFTVIDSAYPASGKFTLALATAKDAARKAARTIGRVRNVLVTVLS